MVQPIPKKIQRNFVYRKSWNNIYQQDKGVVFLAIGDVGTGKSTGMQKVCEDLDPSFNINRIAFSVPEFLRIAKNLKPGQAIVFDEAAGSEEGIDARNALSKTNKLISWFATISRQKRIIVCYIAPFLEQIDKRVKKIGITGIFCFTGVDKTRKRSTAYFYWSIANAMQGWVSNPHPRMLDEDGFVVMIDKVTVPLPSKPLRMDYKKKKNIFLDERLSEWAKEFDEEEKPKKAFKVIHDKILENPEPFLDLKGKVSLYELIDKFDVGLETAKIIRQSLNPIIAKKLADKEKGS